VGHRREGDRAGRRGEIDFLAGPSEVLVLADETADPDLVASDLIAQAEHDPNASVVAVTDDAALAEAVAEAVDEQVAGRKREETIRAALDNDASGVLHARSMPEAVLFTEEYAAEHLSIAADDDEALLARISNAGSVFLGAYSPRRRRRLRNRDEPRAADERRRKALRRALRRHLPPSSTVQRLDRDALDGLSETITTTLAEAEGWRRTPRAFGRGSSSCGLSSAV